MPKAPLFILALFIAAALPAQEAMDPESILHMGRTLAGYGRHAEALEQYGRVINGSGDPIMAAEAGLSSARSSYALGRFQDAKASLEEALALQTYPALENRARSLAVLLGLDALYEPWMAVETEHLVIHFPPDTEEADRGAWAEACEVDFRAVDDFFSIELPIKLQYWVWTSLEAEAEAGIPASGYLDPGLFLIQSRMSQDRRHELAHILSYHAAKALPPNLGNSFIWEGTATRFEDRGDILTRAREVYADGKDYRGVVSRLWQGGTFDDMSLYPIAGAWVDYLIQRKGRTKFLRLLADQSWTGAQSVYGWELPGLIKAFEKKLTAR